MRLLVVRLSALGDVAILAPVLRMRAEANPDVTFLVAAPSRLEPLFAGLPNVEFAATEKKQSPRALYRQLSALKPDRVADMHRVNRVVGMDWLFRLHGVSVRAIRKRGQKGKPSWQRYDEVLDRCGLAQPEVAASRLAGDFWPVKPAHDAMPSIGIAPFAQHEGKVWPLEKMEQLAAMLAKRANVFLFGSRQEAVVLDGWAERYANVHSLAGRFSFAEELERIGRLNLMVSMDSSNMHFASCMGVPVVSIWGATHPCRGFYGWRQDPAWAVQADMDCRPCSKYGNKPCRKGGYPCMAAITPEQVLERVERVLAQADD